MDGNRILEAAEYCVANCKFCRVETMPSDCNLVCDGEAGIASRILTVRDHVKAEVIGKVREHVRKWSSPFPGCGGQVSECGINRMLDELEQEGR